MPVLTAIACAVAGAFLLRARTTSTIFSFSNKAADLRRVSPWLFMNSSTVNGKVKSSRLYTLSEVKVYAWSAVARCLPCGVRLWYGTYAA
jgi:hypothetical protein